MNFGDVTKWVEEHPTESIVIGAGGLIAILWLLGYFSGSSSASSGSSNLASAYYAAEAQQAVVGGQIQMATIQTAAQTAQIADQANAAVAINAAQTGAATTINGQNVARADYAVAGAWNTAADASNNALLATYSNNATALATAQSNNATALATAQTNDQASLVSGFINKIMPAEIAAQAGAGVAVPNIFAQLPGWGDIGVGGEAMPPAQMAAAGYTSGEIHTTWPP